MRKIKKGQRITIGLIILAVGVLLLGADRLFVAADNASFGQSMTVLTVIALFFFLVAAIWLFRTTFE
jgi:protein-S-isoprenylcysteine O-methyltransferase Ste14